MAIVNWFDSDKNDYGSGTFTIPPDASKTDNPDTNGIPVLGGWDPNGKDIMYFAIISQPGFKSEVCPLTTCPPPKGAPNTLTVIVGASPDQKEMLVDFYYVQMGAGTRTMDWDLNFDICIPDANPTDTQYTGKWTFSKGQVGDDKPASH